MSEKWPSGGSGPVFDQSDVGATGGPVGIAFEREFGAEAQPAGDGHQRLFDPPAQSLARALARRDDDLATRAADAREFVERAFGVGHRGHDILRDHDVERIGGIGQRLGIADRDRLDIGQGAACGPARAPCPASGRTGRTATMRLDREY